MLLIDKVIDKFSLEINRCFKKIMIILLLFKIIYKIFKYSMNRHKGWYIKY